MSLPALFSLIFATLLGLLPIFLLVGRRVIASRLSRRREAGQSESPSESGARGPGDRASEDRSAAVAPKRGVGPMRSASRQSDPSRIPGTANTSARGTSPRHGTGPSRTQDTRSRIEARLGRLTALQRAVVYREILGPPVALRAPGEHERY